MLLLVPVWSLFVKSYPLNLEVIYVENTISYSPKPQTRNLKVLYVENTASYSPKP